MCCLLGSVISKSKIIKTCFKTKSTYKLITIKFL